MANVLFKRGLSTNLPLETYQAQDGVFYLTTDTNRMYVGNGTKLAEINRYVKTVATKYDLPSTNPQPGDFVYVIEGNMLAVYLETAEGHEWVQVNSQGASTDIYASKIEFVEDEEASDETGTTFKLILSRQQKNANGVTTNLEHTEEFETSIKIPIINVDIDYEVIDNSVSIKTIGNGANEDSVGVTIASGNGITISEDEENGEVVISGKSYELTLDGTSFDLKDESNSNVGKPIEIIGDNDWIEVSNDTSNNENKIKISHKSKEVAKITPDEEEVTLSDKTSIPVITGLTTDDNNHITGIEETTLIAENTTYRVETLIDNTDENKGKLVVGLRDQDENLINATPLDISFKVGIDGKEAKNIHPGTSLGNIYSKEEMDRKFSALNAMTYMGVVNSLSELPEKGSKGDTYKVGTEFSIEIGDENISLKVGDLLILNGEEENDEVENPVWDRIESGEAADTTYTLSTSDDSESGVSPAILLTNDINGDVQTLNFVDDDIVNVSTKDRVISITHGKIETKEGDIGVQETPGADTTLDVGGSLSVITGIVANDYGHVESVETTEFTLPAGDEIVADKDEVSLTFKDGNGSNQGSIQIVAGDELEVTATEMAENGLIATIGHAMITKQDTPDTVNSEPNTTNPEHGGTFDVVESITYNDYGHVSEVKTTTVTLPAETTYDIAAPTVGEDNDSVTWELKDSDNNTKGSIQLISESIKFTVSTTDTGTTDTGTTDTGTTNNVSIELIWGEF